MHFIENLRLQWSGLHRGEQDGVWDDQQGGLHHHQGGGEAEDEKHYIQFNLKKFQVCSPDTVSNCEEIENVNCNLVPDLVCRNITETR